MHELVVSKKCVSALINEHVYALNIKTCVNIYQISQTIWDLNLSRSISKWYLSNKFVSNVLKFKILEKVTYLIRKASFEGFKSLVSHIQRDQGLTLQDASLVSQDLREDFFGKILYLHFINYWLNWKSYEFFSSCKIL